MYMAFTSEARCENLVEHKETLYAYFPDRRPLTENSRVRTARPPSATLMKTTSPLPPPRLRALFLPVLNTPVCIGSARHTRSLARVALQPRTNSRVPNARTDFVMHSDRRRPQCTIKLNASIVRPITAERAPAVDGAWCLALPLGMRAELLDGGTVSLILAGESPKALLDKPTGYTEPAPPGGDCDCADCTRSRARNAKKNPGWVALDSGFSSYLTQALGDAVREGRRAHKCNVCAHGFYPVAGKVQGARCECGSAWCNSHIPTDLECWNCGGRPSSPMPCAHPARRRTRRRGSD